MEETHAGKYLREEKGTTENEMIGCNHRSSEHDLTKLWEMVKDRKAWCAKRGCKESGQD